MAVTYILFPGETPEVARMGGKASALARLGNAFSAPAWFVVVPEAFGRHGLKDDARIAVAKAAQALGPGPFAVRSSAIEEDSADSSFAGQLQSYLRVPAADVVSRIHDVWRSAFTESVLEYRQQRGLEGPPKSPAVIVQNMVEAEVAGVAFSVDPVADDKDLIVVMAISGLADKLVSGEVKGDTYYLTRDGTVASEILVNDASVLNDNRKREVALLALAAERHFGQPQDVEWAFEDGHLYILQSRPITTLRKGSLTIWDNSNIVESYSGVTAPLTFSFARYVYAEVYRAFSRLMGVPHSQIEANQTVFENMLGYINGRVFYNLLNWYRALALFPGFTVNRAFMERMMGVRKALPQTLADELVPGRSGVWAKTYDALRLGRTFLRFVVHAVILPRTIGVFYDRLNQVLKAPDPPLEEMDLQALGIHYRLLERELLSRWDAPLINDFLCMVAFGASQQALRKWCGVAEGGLLHNDFMIGQGDIVSAEPTRRIRRMAEIAQSDKDVVEALVRGDRTAVDRHPDLKTEFDAYLEKFGDRCTQELKLESVTLDEDPTSLLQAVGLMAGKGPQERRSDTLTAPEHRLRVALRKKPIRYALALFLVSWAKARIRDRENLRFERTRVFGRIRRVFLEIGSRLANSGLIEVRRDIFYLQVPEVLGLIEGTMATYDLSGLVALRRKDAERFSVLPDPPNRFDTFGAVFPDICDRDLRETTSLAEGELRQGLGCCRGVVRAPVRVVRDPRSEGLRPGEILVAQHTDPGWIAVFSNAAGILVERGSLLSHSAIVAREMGIPAIVAISDVMSWLRTGDVVEMDGATGTVVKVDLGEERN